MAGEFDAGKLLPQRWWMQEKVPIFLEMYRARTPKTAWKSLAMNENAEVEPGRDTLLLFFITEGRGRCVEGVAVGGDD